MRNCDSDASAHARSLGREAPLRGGDAMRRSYEPASVGTAPGLPRATAPENCSCEALPRLRRRLRRRLCMAQAPGMHSRGAGTRARGRPPLTSESQHEESDCLTVKARGQAASPPLGFFARMATNCASPASTIAPPIAKPTTGLHPKDPYTHPAYTVAAQVSAPIKNKEALSGFDILIAPKGRTELTRDA